MPDGGCPELLTLSRTDYLDCNELADALAMAAPTRAPERRQVSRLTCRFAGPTDGTVARSHSSLD